MLLSIVSGMLASAGVVFLGRGLLDLSHARASVHWPLVEGKVLGSGIERRRGVHSGTRYAPVVRYEYQHEGTIYEGTRFMFSGFDLTGSEEDARRFIRPFQPGARIVVRICPTKPGTSVIGPGVDRSVWLALLIAMTLLLVGVAGLTGHL